MTVPIPRIEHYYNCRDTYIRTWELVRLELLQGLPLETRRSAWEKYNDLGVETAISVYPLRQWVSWVNGQRERLSA